MPECRSSVKEKPRGDWRPKRLVVLHEDGDKDRDVRAVHDRGGWPEAGPIDRTEHSLEDWERRTDAMVQLLARPGKQVIRVEVRVLDSTADVRYLVLPPRPPGTEQFSEEELAQLVTRDSMIGTANPAFGAPASA
jgi:hypothetical protein